MKKLLSGLLMVMAMILFISSPLSASASASSNFTAKSPTPTFKSSPVAEITIFSQGTGNHGLGQHAWISIKNLTSKTIKVGKYDLKSKKEVTVGTWGNISKAPKGVFYNIEAMFANKKKPSYSGRISLTAKMNQATLNNVNSTILSNNTWDYTKNCSSFATKVWNVAVASNQKLSAKEKLKLKKTDVLLFPLIGYTAAKATSNPLVYIDTPKGLYDSIKSKKGYQINKKIQSVSANDIMYFKSNKKTKVSSSSIKNASSF